MAITWDLEQELLDGQRPPELYLGSICKARGAAHSKTAIRAAARRPCANATRETQDGLVAIIANSRFRPRPTSGRFIGDSHVVLRYHVYDDVGR